SGVWGCGVMKERKVKAQPALLHQNSPPNLTGKLPHCCPAARFQLLPWCPLDLQLDDHGFLHSPILSLRDQTPSSVIELERDEVERRTE
ncbi:hypothetical protein KI387_010224, partial [Taxus chinensis]